MLLITPVYMKSNIKVHKLYYISIIHYIIEQKLFKFKNLYLDEKIDR